MGMVPRGEVGLIVALAGLQMKVISEPVYALVIFMTGATTLVAPPLVKILFREQAVPASAGTQESTSAL
jgi:Kef-type K+ transport system membrane component KefB